MDNITEWLIAVASVAAMIISWYKAAQAKRATEKLLSILEGESTDGAFNSDMLRRIKRIRGFKPPLIRLVEAVEKIAEKT